MLFQIPFHFQVSHRINESGMAAQLHAVIGAYHVDGADAHAVLDGPGPGKHVPLG